METIRYDVKAPDLRGKTNEQQALAIEEYVRETTRQMGIILRQLQDRAKAQEQAAVDSEKKLETEIAEAVAASEARMGDYPVEVGTDGIWRYRKWASGDAECWGFSQLSVAANGWSGSGSLYYINGTEAFPEGLFQGVPELWPHPAHDSLGGNLFMWVAKHVPQTKDTATYRLMRSSNFAQAVTINVSLFAKGKWKTGGDDNGQ